MKSTLSLFVRAGLSIGLALPLLSPIAVRAGELKTVGDPCGKIELKAKKGFGMPTANLRLRDGACTNGTKILTVVPAGVQVSVIGEAKGWYKVSVGDRTGWMSGEYLRVADAAQEKTTKPMEKKEGAVEGKLQMIGISEADYAKVAANNAAFVHRLKGKVLLRVQKHGETWLVEQDGSLARVKHLGNGEFKRWVEEQKTEKKDVKTEEKEVKKEEKPKATYRPIEGELKLSAATLPGAVELKWTKRTSETFGGYKVVRSPTNADPFYPNDGGLEFLPDRETLSFIDGLAVPGKTYYYRICSLEKDGPAHCGNVVKVTARQR